MNLNYYIVALTGRLIMSNPFKTKCLFFHIFLLVFLVHILNHKDLKAQCDTNLINNRLDSIYKHIYTEGNFTDSLCKEVIQMSDSCKYITGYYWATYFHAIVHYYQLKDYKTAIDIIKNNLNYCWEQDSINTGLALYFLFNGIMDYRMDNFENSYKNLLKSIEISKIAGNKRSLAFAYTFTSFIYSFKQQKDSSLIVAILADSLYEQLPNKLDKAISKNNLGEFYLYYGNLELAEHYLKEALAIYTDLGHYYGIVYVKNNLAQVYFKRKEYKLAEDILTKCYKEAYEKDYEGLIYSISNNLHMVYDSLQNAEKAYYFFKIATNERDSFMSALQINKINTIRENYKLQLKESENKELKRLNSINKLKLKNKQVIQWSVSIVLLLLLIFTIVLYKKYKKIKLFSDKIRRQEQEILKKEKEKVEQKLEYKKRELAIKTLKIFHTNQLIDELSGKLTILRSKIRSKGKTGEDLRKDIQSMLNEIRLSSNNKIWKEVEYSFNEANPDFLNWLGATFPNLTSNEVKLCVFSMLNLRVKEISMIWMKSQVSVQVARTRLRKKLMINDSSITLSGYLHKKYQQEVRQ